MKKLWLPYICFLFSCVNRVADGGLNDLDPELMRGQRGNPGLQLQFTDTGIEYIKELGVRVLNRAIPTLRIGDIRQKIMGQGDVNIQNIQIIGYREPAVTALQLSPPNKITFQFRGMGIRAIGKFDAKVTAVLVPVNAKGDFQATIGNLDFQITIAVSADDVGYPALSAENCIAESSMDLSISNAGALLDLALNFLKGLIIGQVRPKLESEICRLVTRMINNDANKILHSMPLWVPLDGTANGGLVGRRKRETDIIRQIARRKGLVLDYRLLRPPRVAEYQIITPLVGEISWEGGGGTPFHPVRMEPFPDNGYMLNIQASDYMINSLLYHAFQHNKLTFNINPKTNPQFGPMLKTSCAGDSIAEFCVGDLLNVVADAYPNHYVALEYTPSKPPTLFFRSDKATVKVQGRLAMSVFPPNDDTNMIRIANAEMELEADARISIGSDNVIRGEVIITKFPLKLINSRITGLTQEDFSLLSDLAKSVLSDAATAAMKNGIPLPGVKGLRLRNPRLSFHDRYVLVETYFMMNELILSRIIGNAMQSIGR